MSAVQIRSGRTPSVAVEDPGVLDQLAAHARAVAAADEARLQQAIGSVRWERRGLLQRLKALQRPAD
ncbi:MAG: hypothetical protein WBB74_12445 [Gaiellaceae bacterium]